MFPDPDFTHSVQIHGSNQFDDFDWPDTAHDFVGSVSFEPPLPEGVTCVKQNGKWGLLHDGSQPAGTELLERVATFHLVEPVASFSQRVRGSVGMPTGSV